MENYTSSRNNNDNDKVLSYRLHRNSNSQKSILISDYKHNLKNLKKEIINREKK